MNLEKSLIDDLNVFKTAPFLFIGSGFSRRYFGIENWSNLLRKFCVDGMKPFEYYNSKAGSHLPTVASEMSEDFFEIWWSSADFRESREKYTKFGDMTEKSSPLKYEIARYILSYSLDNIIPEYMDEIESFKKVVMDGIITTNWDMLLEFIFKDYEVFVGQKGLINSNVQEIAEIYKIHGSAIEFNSLVLTDIDYTEFNDKNPYLAAKLLTIFIENPVIFIGYSISDENIQGILRAITSCLNDYGIDKIKKNIYFVEPIFDSSEDQFESTMITIDDFHLPIKLIKLKDYSKLYDALSVYQRKLSVKQLRQIKSHLYEIVKTNDPNGKISVFDLDESSDYSEVEYVLGVGITEGISKHGYLGLDYDDLIEDIILSNKDLDPIVMVDMALPRILKHSYRAPFNKYLYEGGYRTSSGNLQGSIHEKIISRQIKNNEAFTKAAIKAARKNPECTYEYNLSPESLLSHIHIYGKESINLEQLRGVIAPYISKLREPEYQFKSAVRKMARIYDWLKYY